MKEETVSKSHLERNNIIVAALLTILAFLFYQGQYGLAVLAGGCISIANLRVWSWAIKRIAENPEQPQAKVYALVGVKTLLLMGVFALCLSKGNFHPVALVIGFMSFSIAMLLETLKF